MSFICSRSFSAAAVNIVAFFVVVCKLFDSAILPIDFYEINKYQFIGSRFAYTEKRDTH